MNRMIDLHAHTTASDGQYGPSDLVEKAHGLGIKYLAVTDHDSVSGVGQALQRARELGIECIPGIEISTAGAAEMHILGYGIDIDSEAVRQMCRRFVDLRRERAEKIIGYLQSKGVSIVLEDVYEYAKTELIARPHFARVLLENGYVGDIREAFDKYLATPEFDKIERPKPPPEEGIRMIHAAGGAAVLAHPVSLGLSGTELDAMVRKLLDAGLDGIETYYGQHSPEQKQEYHALASRYGLVETAGSDFHGENVKPDISLGMGSEGVNADRIMQLLNERIGGKPCWIGS